MNKPQHYGYRRIIICIPLRHPRIDRKLLFALMRRMHPDIKDQFVPFKIAYTVYNGAIKYNIEYDYYKLPL